MENTISWTIPNLITVTLMVLVVFFAAAFVFRAFAGKKAAPAAEASA